MFQVFKKNGAKQKYMPCDWLLTGQFARKRDAGVVVMLCTAAQ
jgi:hypothetical protein